MNQFKFRAVGQGLFYTGISYEYNFSFIYDCGSSEKSDNFINNEIDNFCCEMKKFNQNSSYKPHVDFTVVSHLHTDHFNGLFKLSQKVGLGRIFLPYISNDANLKALALGGAILSKNNGDFAKLRDTEALDIFSFAYSLYQENGEAFDIESERNINLREDYGNGRETDDSRRRYSRLRKEKSRNAYYDYVSAEPLDSARNNWNFMLLNKSAKQKKLNEWKNTLDTELEKLGIGQDELFDFIVNNDDGFNRLSEIYKKVFKSGTALNNTSVMLLHYPEQFKYFNCRTCNDVCFSESAATLLTGDGSMDRSMQRIIRSKLSNKAIAVLQIPHHGARDNWLALKRNWIKSGLFAVSFGIGNKYGHPNAEIVSEIAFEKLNVVFVTQLNSFEYRIVV